LPLEQFELPLLVIFQNSSTSLLYITMTKTVISFSNQHKIEQESFIQYNSKEYSLNGSFYKLQLDLLQA